MKGVILAAGIGSRLGRKLPKCLTQINNDETIIGRQIRLLKENGINEIIAVVGFKKELIMEFYPEILYKYNPLYSVTNTSKSLLEGIKDLYDDVIWLNGDTVFDGNIIKLLISHQGNAVAVNTSRCAEEEVKYKTDKNGFITEISKKVKEAEGEAVGINKITKEDIDEFKQALLKCNADDYFERAIEIMINGGKKFKAIDIGENRCIEIDFKEDLSNAIDLFKK
ncbi:phosphocholine cytidylyltransferase family protein [Caldanaerobius polysaccharolyticus]|uniref:phosphocholine cytidylyltransferase family protein n=1 Tax=Caldanaerobius polysaccharolyticus TaxID=44256 RepID=UPI00047C31AF|nr:phosphocholine cytidylyltransferase family protein [Caldanaerobius polysaccharolyticus]